MPAIETSDEFSTAMQQLSAEAAKLLPVKGSSSRESFGAASDAVNALNQRVDQLEQSFKGKTEYVVEHASQSPGFDFATRFGKIDEQLAAIRSTDQMNARLVDTLHSELAKYRDNFIHESLQKPFIHDLVLLFDDLTSLSEQLRTALDQKGSRRIVQWRENLENAVHSLLEILHRFEVKEIETMEKVDRAIHKVISHEPAEFVEDDGRIVMRVKRGFVWRGKLIRPEEVIAKRFS